MEKYQLVLDCLEDGAGSCRNEDLIEQLRAERDAARAEADALRATMADWAIAASERASHHRAALAECDALRADVSAARAEADALRERVTALLAELSETTSVIDTLSENLGNLCYQRNKASEEALNWKQRFEQLQAALRKLV